MADLGKLFRKLLVREPFYGLFATGLQKEYSERVPTAAVTLRGINVVLLLNRQFMDSLTEQEALAVLSHEIKHITLFHPTMSKSFSNHTAFNIAADCVINELKVQWEREAKPLHTYLPDSCITHSSVEQMCKCNLERSTSTKYYYEKLMQHAKDQMNKLDSQGDGQGEGQDGGGSAFDTNKVGDHSFWKEFSKLSEAEKKLVQNQIEHVMKNTAEQVKRQAGNIPSELRDIIDELLNPKPPVFNWRAYFRRLVGNSNRVYQKKNRKRESTRFEEFAKTQNKYKQKILVCIDTSGSICNDDLIDFFSEVHHMYKSGVAIDILECDCQIGRVYEYKGKPDTKITGGGGTSCQPIIDYIKKHPMYTTKVYFTDGYLDTKPAEKFGLIWLITNDGDHDQTYPGMTIKIPKRK